MTRFATTKISAVNGRRPFRQLEIDDIGQLDKFEDEIRNNPGYMSQFRTILTHMEYNANDGRPHLPGTKYHLLKPERSTSAVQEFEYKSKDLRVYGIKLEDGSIIMLGGFKNKQPQDISAFRGLKKKYLASLKPERK